MSKVKFVIVSSIFNGGEVMTNSSPPQQPEQQSPRWKKWAINILIVVVVTIAMLAVAEVGMRVIDGFQLFSVDLEQGAN
jgi:ABC-type Fe3+ transport system permease subunit